MFPRIKLILEFNYEKTLRCYKMKSENMEHDIDFVLI